MLLYSCKVDTDLIRNEERRNVMIDFLLIKIALVIWLLDQLLDLEKKLLENRKLRLENKKLKSELKYKRKH